jgi:hypothetical protein
VRQVRRVGLTTGTLGGTMADASTSLGEASARIQATDLERRKTPRVRTAPPGLRVEPKWLPESPDTPCSAKALTRGVPPDRCVGQSTSLRASAASLPVSWPRGGEAEIFFRRWFWPELSEIDDRFTPIRSRQRLRQHGAPRRERSGREPSPGRTTSLRRSPCLL